MINGDDWYKSQKWNDIEPKLQGAGFNLIYFPCTKTTSSTLINQMHIERCDLR
jgi:hypothetical protein